MTGGDKILLQGVTWGLGGVTQEANRRGYKGRPGPWNNPFGQYSYFQGGTRGKQGVT